MEVDGRSKVVARNSSTCNVLRQFVRAKHKETIRDFFFEGLNERQMQLCLYVLGWFRVVMSVTIST